MFWIMIAWLLAIVTLLSRVAVNIRVLTRRYVVIVRIEGRLNEPLCFILTRVSLGCMVVGSLGMNRVSLRRGIPMMLVVRLVSCKTVVRVLGLRLLRKVVCFRGVLRMKSIEVPPGIEFVVTTCRGYIMRSSVVLKVQILLGIGTAVRSCSRLLVVRVHRLVGLS